MSRRTSTSYHYYPSIKYAASQRRPTGGGPRRRTFGGPAAPAPGWSAARAGKPSGSAARQRAETLPTETLIDNPHEPGGPEAA